MTHVAAPAGAASARAERDGGCSCLLLLRPLKGISTLEKDVENVFCGLKKSLFF